MAMDCVQEMSALVGDQTVSEPTISNRASRRSGPNPSQSGNEPGRPVADIATLSVRWEGKSCHLGYTLPFKLFERLARRPNCFVSYSQLLEDVWCQCRSDAAIRSVVKELKRKLIEAGMLDIAAAIRGEGRCYGLILEPPG